MNTHQAKAFLKQMTRIADVLEKLEAKSDHFLVALSHVAA